MSQSKKTWKRGSKPTPGEYELILKTGGKVNVWVGQDMVILNDMPHPLEKAFEMGFLRGPVEEE